MTGMVYAPDSNGTPLREVNPYAHFGQATIWPRGYPLDKIGSSMADMYDVCEYRTPSIQQGVVNGDPDVDAIFRLTRTNTVARLNLTFDSTAPPVTLPPGTFCPFNSQNTLYHYSAFWGLLLPTTTTFRVCDIWRGYWAQRLLWETGDQLGFFPPNGFQHRNSHSYLSDALEKKQLYYNSTNLVDMLRNYQCSATSDFYGCVVELSRKMVTENFWKTDDYSLVTTWLEDLNQIGYTSPVREKRISTGMYDRTCSTEMLNGKEVRFTALQQPTPIINWSRQTRILQNHKSIKDLEHSICPGFIPPLQAIGSAELESSLVFNDILLIIIFNRYHFDVIPVLELMYRPNFPNILYCGEFLPEKQNISLGNIQYSFYAVPDMGVYGHYGYECMAGAIQMGYNVSGYFLINDDVRLNIWRWANFNRSAMIFEDIDSQVVDIQSGKKCRRNDVRICDIAPNYKWLKMYRKQVASTIDRLKVSPAGGIQNTCYRRLVAANKGDYKVNFNVSDVYYIPRRLAANFVELATVFRQEVVFVGLAVPTIIRCLDEPANLQVVKHLFLWLDRSDDAPWARWQESLQYHSFHPYKISPLLQNHPSNIQHFCTDLLPMLYQYRPDYWR